MANMLTLLLFSKLESMTRYLLLTWLALLNCFFNPAKDIFVFYIDFKYSDIWRFLPEVLPQQTGVGIRNLPVLKLLGLKENKR